MGYKTGYASLIIEFFTFEAQQHLLYRSCESNNIIRNCWPRILYLGVFGVFGDSEFSYHPSNFQGFP
jgi:hypothetical protein